MGKYILTVNGKTSKYASKSMRDSAANNAKSQGYSVSTSDGGSSSSGSNYSSSSNRSSTSSGSSYNSSTGSKNSSSSSSKVNTSVLSGYAKYYADAINNGYNNDEAHKYATYKNGGSGLTNNDISYISGKNENRDTNKNGHVKNEYDTGFYESDYLKQLEQMQMQQGLLDEKNALIEALKKQLANQKSPQEIYDKIMGMMPERPEVPVLGYEEALSRARNELGGLYNQRSKEMLNQIDKNNIQRGFYGQLPADAMKRFKASELEVQANKAINDLANNLVGQSKADADKKQQLALQDQQAQLNTLMSALQQSGAMQQNNIGNILSMLNYYGNEEDRDMRNKFGMADRIGYLDGTPTMAMKQYLHGLDREKVADDRYLEERDYNRQWNEGERDFNRGVTEAGLTGTYKGQNTMAKNQMLFNQDMANKNYNLNYQQFKDSSARGWANYDLSKQKAEQGAKSTGMSPESYSKLYNVAYDNVLARIKGRPEYIDMKDEDIEKLVQAEIRKMMTNPFGVDLGEYGNSNNAMMNALSKNTGR